MKYTYDNYSGVKLYCNTCGGELEQKWHDDIGSTFCTYECKCGETKLNSERFHSLVNYYRDKEKEKAVDGVVTLLMDFVNSSGNSKMLIEKIARQHRTLQQGFTGICLKWLQHCASLTEGQYDGRNEASVKLAREIMEKVPDAKYGLPLI